MSGLKNMRIGLLALFLGLALAASARAQVAVVVHAENETVADITRQQLVDIYTGKMAAWQDSKARIYPVALSLKTDGGRRFFTAGLGKSKRQLERIWLKLALSGVAKPPKVADTDHELLEYIARHKGAIGFVPLAGLDLAAHPQIKIIAVEGALPDAADYPFADQ